MGGLFRKVFGGKKKEQSQQPAAEEPAWNTSPFWQEEESGGANPLYGTNSPAVLVSQPQARQEQETEEDLGKEMQGPLPEGVVVDFQQLRSQLFRSEKGGLGFSNSDKYQVVADTLNQVITEMAQGFTSDREESRAKVIRVFDHMVKLIKACDAYTARKSRTSNGRARQDIARGIKALAERDIVGVRAQIDHMQFLSPKEMSELTWQQIIQNARTTRIVLNKGYDELKFTGGQASRVAIVKEGADTKGKGGFFKLEENFTLDENHSLKNRDAALGMIPLPAQLEARIRQINDIDDFNPADFGEQQPQAKQFWDMWFGLNEAYNTKKQILTNQKRMNMNLSGGNEINLSRRNVAMSRIAELLGIGDVVARSDTAEIVDAGGASRRGNIMEGASGQQASEGIKQIKEKHIQRIIEEGGDYYKFGQDSTYQQTFESASLQKSISNLQVLDELCGQVDRHAGNYFMQMENGVPVSVQGIDNDFSFGYNKLGGITDMESKSRDVVRDGQIWIPHMDKALAQKILALNPSMARYALMDLIEPEAIAAFIDRLNDMQKALKIEMKKPNSQVFVENDSGWNQQTSQNFLAKSPQDMLDAKVNRAFAASSYYSEMITGLQDFGWAIDAAKKVKRELALNKVAALSADGRFHDVNNVIAFLQQYTSAATKQEMEEYARQGRILPNIKGDKGEEFMDKALSKLGDEEFEVYYKQKQEQKAQREQQLKQQQTQPAIG